jgi:ABC-type phosphate transport system substrate-binding protein
MKIFIIAALLYAHAGPPYRVIVHPDNPATSIDRRTLSDIFLKKQTSWPDGERTAPVDHAGRAAVRDEFTEAVHNKSLSAVRNYWQQLIFSGRGLPPPELDSDEAVVSFVLSHRGAVGYVSEGAKIGAAKVLVVR